MKLIQDVFSGWPVQPYRKCKISTSLIRSSGASMGDEPFTLPVFAFQDSSVLPFILIYLRVFEPVRLWFNYKLRLHALI